MPTEILANGMVMIEVEMLWLAAAVIATVGAIVVLVAALLLRPPKRPRRSAVLSLVISAAPFLVLGVYSHRISTYARDYVPVALMLSSVPLVLSGLAVWLTWRRPSSGSGG